MVRFFSLALALVFCATSTSAQHIRAESAATSNTKNPEDDQDLVLSTTHVTAPEEEDKPQPPSRACFSVEKGMKCGGLGAKMKIGQKCEAGMKKEFHAKMKSDEILHSVTPDLQEQLTQLVPTVEDVLPQDEATLQQLKELDEAAEEMMKLMEMGGDVDLTKSKTVEFGGAAMMHWGCKASISFEKGTVAKKVECGAKGGGGAGMKPGEAVADTELIM